MPTYTTWGDEASSARTLDASEATYSQPRTDTAWWALAGEEIYVPPPQLGARDLRVELFYDDSWHNLTSGVITSRGVNLVRGRTGESTSASPGSCSLTFDNRTGAFSPRYTAGLLYGKIGRNTPMRVGLGKPVVGEVRVGTGTTLTLGSIFETTGYPAQAVAGLGFINTVTNLTTPSGYVSSTEVDTATFTARRAYTTDAGGNVPASSFTASASGNWATAHVAIPGGLLGTEGFVTASAGGNSVIDFSSWEGQVGTAICVWSADPYDRMGAPKFTGQMAFTEMYMVADSGVSTGPRVMVWAWKQNSAESGEINLEGAHDGSTASAMLITSWGTAVNAYTARFTGEVADWPQEWDPTESYWVAPVQAGGALRRLTASQDTVSALYGAFRGSAGLLGYWPMEGGPDAREWPATTGSSPMRIVPVASPEGLSAVPYGSQPIPFLQGTYATATVSGSGTTSWGFGAVFAIGNTDDFFPIVSPGGSDLGGVTLGAFTSGATTQMILEIGTAGGSGFVSVAATFPNGLLNRQGMVYVTMTQNGGNVDWTVYVWNLTPGEAIASSQFSGSTAGTLGKIRNLTVGYDTVGSEPGVEQFAVGHAFVTSGTTLVESTFKAEAGRGFDATLITDAVERTARDAGFRTNITTEDTWDVLRAGPVAAGPAADNLRLLEAAGQGLLADAAGFIGLDWRPYAHLISQSPAFTLAYAGETLTGALSPVDDDATTLNDVTVTAWNGSARVQVSSGALGNQPGGVGRYAAQYTLPVRNVTAAADVAGWLTSLGTIDAARWPTLTLEMVKSGNVLLDLPTFSLGDVVQITGLPARTGPSTVDVQVVGMEEAFDARLYRLTLHCRLDAPWNVMVWNNANWADSTAPSNSDERWGM